MLTSGAVTLADPSAYFGMLDRAAESHWWARSIEFVERSWVQAAMPEPVRKGLRRWDWLDVGCGTGSRFRHWSDWGCWGKRVGIEPEAGALAGAANVPGIALMVGGAPGLPELGRRFDFVSALDVIQHVAPTERQRAVAELVAAVRPGGVLLLRTNAPGRFVRSRTDTSLIDPRGLRRSLELAGLKILRHSRFNAVGGLWEDAALAARRFVGRSRSEGPTRTGLPQGWQGRPQGHPAAAMVGFAESRILATGLVKFPVGHSYLIIARKEGAHDGSANG